MVPVNEKAPEGRSVMLIQIDVDAGVCFPAPIWTVCWVVVQWWLIDGVMLSEGRGINGRMKVQQNEVSALAGAHSAACFHTKQCGLAPNQPQRDQ